MVRERPDHVLNHILTLMLAAVNYVYMNRCCHGCRIATYNMRRFNIYSIFSPFLRLLCLPSFGIHPLIIVWNPREICHNSMIRLPGPFRWYFPHTNTMSNKCQPFKNTHTHWQTYTIYSHIYSPDIINCSYVMNVEVQKNFNVFWTVNIGLFDPFLRTSYMIWKKFWLIKTTSKNRKHNIIISFTVWNVFSVVL